MFAPPVYSLGPSLPGLVVLAVGFAGQSGPGHFPVVVGWGPAPLLDAEAPGAGLGQFGPPGHLESSPAGAGAGVSPPAGQCAPPGQPASAGGRTTPPAGGVDPPDGPGAWTCPSEICATGLPLGPGAWIWPSGICSTGLPLGAGAPVAGGGAGASVASAGVGLPQPPWHGSVRVTGTGVASQTWHSFVVTVKPSGTWSEAEAHVGVASEQDSVTV
jgi:hypothetical protein